MHMPRISLIALCVSLPLVVGAAPTVKTVQPTKSSTTNGVLDATGTASGLSPLAVYYSLNGGPFAAANGTTNWSIMDLALTPGANTFSAYAQDSTGVSKTNEVKFIYAVNVPITVQTNGFGTVKPDFTSVQIGKAYSMAAKAGKGWGFFEWMLNGDYYTNAAHALFDGESNDVFTAVFTDETRPVCAIVYPAAKHSVSNTPTTAMIRATDKFMPVRRVYYQINSNGWNSANPVGDGTNWTAIVSLNTGGNVLQAYAVDSVGLLSLTNTIPFKNVINPEVLPVATNGAIPQVSVSLVFGSNNYLAAIQGDDTASNDITAQLIFTDGSLDGPRIAIGRTGAAPQVSFDGTNYLVVWCDDAQYGATGNYVIYGQFVSQSGELVGSPFSISDPSADAQWGSLQSIAFDGTNYFVVWMDQSQHNAPPGNAWGIFVGTDGSLESSQLLLSANALEAGVVFGGGTYLVFWENREATANELYDAEGEFVSTDGNMGAPFSISETPSPTYNPMCGAFDGNNFLAVWNKNINSGTSQAIQWNLFGRLVSTQGSFPGNEVALVSDKGEPVLLAVAFGGANYLLTWHEGAPLTGSASQVFFRSFNNQLAAAGAQFNLFSAQGATAPLLGSIASGDGQYAVLCVIGGFAGAPSGPLPSFTGATATYDVIYP